jgi:hypothetical protein
MQGRPLNAVFETYPTMEAKMKRLLFGLIAAAALVVPSTALASGVVLKVERGAHEVAVTTSPSRVSLIHTNARLAVGQRVAFTTHGAKVLGRAHSVRFRGLLVARTSHTMLLSAGGAVMTVRRDDHHNDPRRGAIVEVNPTVGANGALDDNDDNPVVVVTPAALGGKIEGTLTIGADSITVTGDELNLAIKVPAGSDLSAFRNGDDVEATFVQGTDGSLTLTKLELRNDDNNDDDDDGGGHDHGGDGHGGHGDG